MSDLHQPAKLVQTRCMEIGAAHVHADRVADGEGVLAAAHGNFLALVAVRLRRHGAAVELGLERRVVVDAGIDFQRDAVA